MTGIDDDTPSQPYDPKHRVPSDLEFPVVGIGASAGGLEALQDFFGHLPPAPGMAFVVVLHLSPEHESELQRLLQQCTDLPVREVSQPTPIERDHVYVVSPSHSLSMNDGYLRVVAGARPHGRHVAIDLFLRDLADVHRELGIGIVLSGSGADGAVGLTRLKERGGVTLAQDPEEAGYGDMPRAAIDTGMVDFVLPAAQMPARLVELARTARRLELTRVRESGGEPTIGRAPADDVAYRDILAVLRARTGHDFRHYKRATVLRRIERRMQINAMPDLAAYRGFVRANTDETTALLHDLLIGVTNFFRDPEAFDILARDIVPRILERPPGEQVRAWVVGCATGEEAYSLAMLLCEQADRLAEPTDLQVFATDVDENAIRHARGGLYPQSILTDVSAERVRQFFGREQNQFRVKKSVRDKVLFAAHNILRDPPFSRVDLLSCRNLLIYLEREAQAEVLETFHFALRPGGYLFLGTSESADAALGLFEPVDKKNRIYRARTATRVGRYARIAAPPAGAQRSAIDAATPAARRAASFAALHQRVLEQYAAPSIIVNRDSRIVHMSEHAGRFLRYIAGEPSNDLMAVILPELRVELRTALFQAVQTRRSVEARRVTIERGDKTYYVNMTARSFRDAEFEDDFVLVLFDEVEDSLATPEGNPETSGKDPLVLQLEAELQRTREQLESTIEQSATSTEELKASNEELQAINEELRSATEELETSKEELQSINEELITVNHELKVKVEETSKINDDLQNLITSTDIATVFVDGAMRIKRYTPRATDIFSIIPSDIGRSLLDITHRLDYEELSQDTGRVFESLGVIEREVSGAGGRWYLARILPYRTVENRIDGAILTFIDVSSRRKAEDALREGEARMRLVAESTKDYAIITLDPDGLVTSWNRGAERVFGFTEAEMLGEPGDLIFTPEDRARGVPAEERRRAREEGRAEDERWHVRKDGSRLYCSGVMTPLEGGDLRGYAKIARDLTGRKRAEREREVLLRHEKMVRARAQAANQLKDEFLAVMSHELKHPLNLIHVNAELLTRLPDVRDSVAGRKAAQTIQRAVLGQAKIIDDLLDLSRMHTGKLTLNRRGVDWAQVVAGVTDAVRAECENGRIELKVAGLDEPLPLEADEVRVEQIVWNLLSNALKFTPEGGRVMVSLGREAGFGRLDVADTGCGIAAESLPKIFDMFGQVEGHTSRPRSGLGVGLALVRQLAHLHGGRVEAYSEGEGHGSCFTVWLPLPSEAAVVAGGADAGGMDHSGRLAGLRVLLVDDTLDTLEAFGCLLELEGAEVVTAQSGMDALKVVDRESFDLILSDIGMPEMDGHELLTRLRQRPDTARTPAIALTGFGRSQDIRRALDAGFDAHLSKPVRLDALTDVLQKLDVRRGA